MAKFLDDLFITGNETNVFIVNSDNVPNILLASNTGNVAVGGNIFSGGVYANPKFIINTGSGIPGLMHLNSFGVELVTFTNVSDSLFGNASNHDLAFITNNIERIKVLASGNVGINHLTPPAQLTVMGIGSTSATQSLLVGNSSSSILLKIRDDGYGAFGSDVNSNYNFTITGNGGYLGTLLVTDDLANITIKGISLDASIHLDSYAAKQSYLRLSNDGTDALYLSAVGGNYNYIENHLPFFWKNASNQSHTYIDQINGLWAFQAPAAGIFTPTAIIHVRGSDNTASNYSIKAEDALGNTVMTTRNDGDVSLGDSSAYGGTSFYYQKNSGYNGTTYVNPNASNGISVSDFILNVRNTSWGINSAGFGLDTEFVRLNVSDGSSSFQINRQEYNSYLPDTSLKVAFCEGSGFYTNLEIAKFVYTRNLNFNDVNDRTFRGIHIDNTLGTWTNAGSGFAHSIGLHVKDNQVAIFAEGDVVINNLAGSGNRNLEVDSTGKIIVGSDSSSEGIQNVIPFGDTVDVLTNFQYLVYGNLQIDGTLNNAGEVVIINGAMVLGGSGVFNNTGTLTLVDLLTTSTYTSSKAVITFVPGTVGVANTITHNTGSADISVQLWDVTTGQVILANVQNATTTTVDIVFSINPAGSIKAVVIGF
jgi:hypothetical protein